MSDTWTLAAGTASAGREFADVARLAAKFYYVPTSGRCAMWMTIAKGIIAGLVVIGVTQLANKFPRLGALLLTLPLVSILAFILTWAKYRDVSTIATLSKETLVLVPLGLPFFLPLAFAEKLGLSFWPAFVTGLALAAMLIGLWFWLGPDAT